VNTFIQILDVIGAVLIVIALNMVRRDYRWWLFYSGTNIIFSTITIHKGLPGLTVMGFILCLTGVKNYYSAKKKEKIDVGIETMSHLR